VAVRDVMFSMAASILNSRVSISELLVFMPGHGCLVDCQGCIVWDVEFGVVAVHLGSVLQRKNVRCFNERT